MSYIHRCLIVPAALAPFARDATLLLGGEPARGMFTSPLSSNGTEPASHFISSGLIAEEFGPALADPAIMFAACAQAGMATTLAACTALLTESDISEEQGLEAMARLALLPVTPVE